MELQAAAWVYILVHVLTTSTACCTAPGSSPQKKQERWPRGQGGAAQAGADALGCTRGKSLLPSLDTHLYAAATLSCCICLADVGCTASPHTSQLFVMCLTLVAQVIITSSPIPYDEAASSSAPGAASTARTPPLMDAGGAAQQQNSSAPGQVRQQAKLAAAPAAVVSHHKVVVVGVSSLCCARYW
jgi:hypothetical protein